MSVFCIYVCLQLCVSGNSVYKCVCVCSVCECVLNSMSVDYIVSKILKQGGHLVHWKTTLLERI